MRRLLLIFFRKITGMLSKVPKALKTSIITLAIGFSVHSNAYEITNENKKNIENVVNQSFKPLMEKYDVFGMAIGVIYKGESHEQYYGIQSNIDNRGGPTCLNN